MTRALPTPTADDGNRFAQARDSGGWRVAMVAVAKGFYGGFDDVRRRGKIGLSNPQIDDVVALARKLFSACQDLEGGFSAELINACCGFDHI